MGDFCGGFYHWTQASTFVRLSTPPATDGFYTQIFHQIFCLGLWLHLEMGTTPTNMSTTVAHQTTNHRQR